MSPSSPADDTEATARTEPDASTNASADKTLSTESSVPCITDEKWRQHRQQRCAQLAQRKEEVNVSFQKHQSHCK